jgi:hypothetical protein
MTSFANPFQNLRFSESPTERAAQVRVLTDVFSVLEQQHLSGQTSDWSFLSKLADTPVIAETVQTMVESIPSDADFGSFEELQSRRDASGVVRLKR